MSGGKLLKLLFNILIVILILVLFIYTYFFPSLKKINDLRVKGRDCKLRLNDLKKSKSSFVFPDKREEISLEKREKLFDEWIGRIKSEKNIRRISEKIREDLLKLSPGARIEIENRPFQSFKDRSEAGSFDPVSFLPGNFSVKSIYLNIDVKTQTINLKKIFDYIDGTGYPVFFEGLVIEKSVNNFDIKLGYRLLSAKKNLKRSSSTTGTLIDMNSPLLLKKIDSK